jgi:hypothetical protein
MTRLAYLLAAAFVFGGSASASPPGACPIAGELAHWRADFCLFRTETDDIIAAGPCLERESQIRFESSCNGRLHYKRALCELVVGAGQRPGSIEGCVGDPGFMGPTVRNGGA